MCVLLAATATADELGVGWPSYGGDPGGTRFSRLVQITPQNVGHLTRAWEYRTGEVSDGSGALSATSFQATPILFGDTLYFCTAFNRIVALHSAPMATTNMRADRRSARSHSRFRMDRGITAAHAARESRTEATPWSRQHVNNWQWRG